MSDDKTPEAVEPEISVSSPDEEPKQASAKPVGAKPARRKIARNAVVGGGETDPVLYSKARVPGRMENRKSLTTLHIQRRLAEEGFPEAASAPGGHYEALTTRAVASWQESRKEPATGVLTRDQFADLFEGDPNVTVSIDTHADHQI
jgi:peptidoglycan hydrolase-like protein with peptidoglycan-binding domain